MNERIKQLLIQSEVFNKDGTVLKDVTGYELNKFAQLLVADCIELAGNHYDARSAVNDIKQHFGVEE
jgi:predicted nucleotidyltransferase